MIEIHKLSKSFAYSSGHINILHNISLTIEKGKWYTIIGDAGTGKTIFLGCVAGLLAPTIGEVLYDNIQIYQLSDKARSNYRRKHIGFVYQNFKFLPHYSIMDNVILPFIHDEPRKTLYPKALTLLQQVGIHAELFECFPEDLSSEEKYRVAIARALLGNPSVLIIDEPTAYLDAKACYEVLNLLSFYRNQGQTIIMATRDKEAAQLSDYTYKLIDKQLVQID